MEQKTNTEILDNRLPDKTLVYYLRRKLTRASRLRIVSAYFSIFGFEALASQLEADTLAEVCFLLGEPSNAAPITGALSARIFELTEDGLGIQNSFLTQKPLAKRCAAWIKRDCVKIRTIKRANFLHAKMYHTEDAGDDPATVGGSATVGSSNFTQRGLGAKPGHNIELNLAIATDDKRTRDELAKWFDGIWNDNHLVTDVKQQILEALEHIYRDYSPELIYYKTLFEIFYDRMQNQDQEDYAGRVGMEDTKIWKALYDFQQEGYRSIVDCLEKYNGCILADSVGLGKTYTALAVIRRYQRNTNGVLVICPKKLEENWRLYQASAARGNSPFLGDPINYELVCHTDLGRDSGKQGSIDLSNFDWGIYSLVVIDESHNFRNQSKSTYNEDGSIRRMSRYEKLFKDVITSGVETKVLLISATPVNTSLIDLRNQVNLIAAGRDDAFNEKLSIASFSTTIGTAQKQFEQWAKRPSRKKEQLIDSLNGEFKNLLHNIVIARTRRQITDMYNDGNTANTPKLTFPERTKPENRTPPIDTKQELSFGALVSSLDKLKLSIYKPSTYAIGNDIKQQLQAEKKRYNFNQDDRERYLVGMMSVNFIKRLESSPEAFRKTISRLLERIDRQLEQIEVYLKIQQDAELSQSNQLIEDDQLSEDEDFAVSQRGEYRYRLSDLDCTRWRADIERDRAILQSILEQTSVITTERDGKLQRLKELVKERAGAQKHKLLIFTAFTDTARYLYEQLRPLAAALNLNTALVTGSGSYTERVPTTDLHELLARFAPEAHNRTQLSADQRIDILVATDCISEGQNLQDCDTVINYDIHWNPVRIIQRCGRIDRIGTKHKKIYSINFWPTKDIDDYLKLKNRVMARMALVEATTGDLDQFDEGGISDTIQLELDTRDELLRKMQKTALDFEEEEGAIALSDITLSAYQSQLMRFIQDNKDQLERIPMGAYAVADRSKISLFVDQDDPVQAIFLFRRRKRDTRANNNPTDPCYLVCLTQNGVKYGYTSPHATLRLFDELTRGQSKPIDELCRQFDSEIQTDTGKDAYNKLVQMGQQHISNTFAKQMMRQITTDRNALISTIDEQPRLENMELVTWLVIKERKTA